MKLIQSTVSLNNSLQEIIIFSKVCVKASSLTLTLIEIKDISPGEVGKWKSGQKYIAQLNGNWLVFLQQNIPQKVLSHINAL